MRRSGGASGVPTPGAICASSIPSSGPTSAPTRWGCSRSAPRSSGTDDWVRTTDLARLDADGFLWIVGRADQTILRGGIQDPARRRAGRARTRSGGGRGRAWSASTTSGSGRCRSPRSSAGPVTTRRGPQCCSSASACTSRATRCRSRSRVVDDAAAHASGKVDLAAVRAMFADRSATRRGVTVTMERGTFGEAPLPDVEAFADAVRDLTSTVLALEQLERRAPPHHRRGARRAGAAGGAGAGRPRAARRRRCRDRTSASTSTTRATSGATTRRSRCTSSRARTIGPRARSSSPCSTRARPGSCTAGFLAVFFDCVLQQLNCDLGLAGKTASSVAPLPTPDPAARPRSRVAATREIDGDRIRSHAELLLDDTVLCEAEMSAVAGNREALPAVSPRQTSR